MVTWRVVLFEHFSVSRLVSYKLDICELGQLNMKTAHSIHVKCSKVKQLNASW